MRNPLMIRFECDVRIAPGKSLRLLNTYIDSYAAKAFSGFQAMKVEDEVEVHYLAD